MSKVSPNTMRKKIAAYAAKSGGAGAGAGLTGAAGAINRILTEFYGIKLKVSCAPQRRSLLGAFADELKNELHAVFYRSQQHGEFLLWLDRLFIATAAGWSHEKKLPDMDAVGEAEPTTIDCHLAEALAQMVAHGLVSETQARPTDIESLGFERIEAGRDPSRFVYEDEAAPSVMLRFTAENINGIALGEMVIVLPAAALLPGLADNAEGVGAPLAWRRDLALIAGRTAVSTRAVIAQEPLDMAAVTGLQVGQTLALTRAAIDQVAIECAQTQQPLAIEGAMREFNGRRAVHLRAAGSAAPPAIPRLTAAE